MSERVFTYMQFDKRWVLRAVLNEVTEVDSRTSLGNIFHILGPNTLKAKRRFCFGTIGMFVSAQRYSKGYKRTARKYY